METFHPDCTRNIHVKLVIKDEISRPTYEQIEYPTKIDLPIGYLST